MPVTNRGAFRAQQSFFRNTSTPTVFYLALFDSTTAPVVDTNTFSQLTEIPAGNGYTTGGISIARNSTDFDVLTEDDTNDYSYIQLKDIVWTASGGSIPASGAGARYACLTDDNATQASRDIIVGWDLASNRVVSTGQTLTIQNAEIRFSTV